ncbi:MAG: extracellular solute-binding protein [Sporolactobacillus sp.]
MKKLLVILVSLVLALSLGACGGSASQAAKSKDVVTVLTYPLYDGNSKAGQPSYKDRLQSLIKEFEKSHPNIQIKVQYVSWDQGPEKFSVALNAGTPPDIFFTTSTPEATFIKSGLAVPLNKYLTKNDLNDIEPAAIRNWTLSNKIWGVQMWNALYTLGGNVDLLKSKGVDIQKIQKDGWTWDQFYKIAAKFKDAKTSSGQQVYGFLTMGDNTAGDETYAELMRNNGVIGMVSPSGKFKWQGTKAVETLNFMQKLLDNGIMPKYTAQISQEKMTDMFNDGEAAIFGRIGPYQIPQNDLRNKEISQGKVSGPKLDLALLPFPHYKGEKQVTIGGGGGYALFRQKKYQGEQHTKDAAAVLKWLTGTKASSAAADQFIIPARYSGQKMYAKQLQFNTDNGKFELNYLNKVVLSPKLSSALAAKATQADTNAVQPKYQSFLAGELKATDAVTQWTQAAESILNGK